MNQPADQNEREPEKTLNEPGGLGAALGSISYDRLLAVLHAARRLAVHTELKGVDPYCPMMRAIYGLTISLLEAGLIVKGDANGVRDGRRELLAICQADEDRHPHLGGSVRFDQYVPVPGSFHVVGYSWGPEDDRSHELALVYWDGERLIQFGNVDRDDVGFAMLTDAAAAAQGGPNA